MMCFLRVCEQMYFSNVDLPVPAFPVRKTELRVNRISFRAVWNSGFCSSIVMSVFFECRSFMYYDVVESAGTVCSGLGDVSELLAGFPSSVVSGRAISVGNSTPKESVFSRESGSSG